MASFCQADLIEIKRTATIPTGATDNRRDRVEFRIEAATSNTFDEVRRAGGVATAISAQYDGAAHSASMLRDACHAGAHK